VLPVISYEWSILAAREKNYTSSDFKYDIADADTPPQKVIQFIDDKQNRDDISTDVLYEKGAAPSIVSLVERLITEAIKSNASDIHIEPKERFTQVRYRIDGDLHNMSKHDRIVHEPLVSRIKILSNLDITNRRLPQDGNFYVSLLGRKIDIRVSTVPSIHGEKVVIRLLDQRLGLIPLEELGMPGYIQDPITEIFKKPQGMLIVTGPTGSGKTTTLNACISQLRSESKNIITIENPVEYEIEGVTQIPVNEAIGRTFALILRSVLRQDPDIIMVGEVRDIETAKAAIESALTGHLVLTTLHTNNTVATITRLLQIGTPSYLLSSALSGILAQRLAKKICDYCKVKSKVPDDL
jgi:type II secretory ATPase GspE/PulE/Tfp pilus assembly ATPase PilB-like protein